jgi:hypothetical protein
MNSMTVKRGGSTDIFEIAVGGVSDYTDYRGTLVILDPATEGAVLYTSSVSPGVSGGFSIAFSPVQTEVLAVGSYTVVFEIIKEVATVIEFRRELSWTLKITPSLINS